VITNEHHTEAERSDVSTNVVIIGDDWAQVSRTTLLLHRRGFSVLGAGPGLDPVEMTREHDATFVIDIRPCDHPDDCECSGTTARDGECAETRTVVYQRVGTIDGAVDDHSEVLLELTDTIARAESGSPDDGVLEVNDLELDTRGHRLRVAGQPVQLAATPFELLRILMEHADQVLSKPQLLDLLYDYDGYDANLVEAHISTIRRAIDFTHPHIETVRGVGYVIRSTPDHTMTDNAPESPPPPDSAAARGRGERSDPAR
jgi:two-component system OmpR family response regulator